jgi:cyclase
VLTKRIIPCLDVKDGRVVKGVQFVGLRDAGDPVECAARYDEEGADELCFLDITASHEKRDIIVDVVRSTAESVFMPLTVGGGVREEKDVRRLLKAGADKVSINTAAVSDPDFVAAAARRFGSQCTVVAVDARGRHYEDLAHSTEREPRGMPVWAGTYPELLIDPVKHEGWEVYTHGGKIGYDLKLTSHVADAVGIPVIASGGVGGPEHLLEGFTTGKADAVLAASIFHYGEYTIAECKEFLAEHDVPVRL